RREMRGQCSTCHVNPQGGGPRNPFGQAFEKNNKMITPELRAAWPDRFLPSVSTQTVETTAGAMTATLLAGSDTTVLQIGNQYYRLRRDTAALEKIDEQTAAQLRNAGSAPGAALVAQSRARSELTLENVPTFDHYLINLPTNVAYAPGVLSMRFTHRFTQPVIRTGDNDCPDCAGAGDLYGLDSFSYSSFGIEYGITRRFAAFLYRSPLDKDYEFGGVARLLDQQGRAPVAATLRLSLETRRLFDPRKIGQNDTESRFQTFNVMLPLSH